MKLKNTALIASLLLSSLSFGAHSAFAAKADCSYCTEMEKLKSGFAKVKPEPLNAKTIDRQNELVESSTDLLKIALKDVKHLSDEDWKRLMPFIAIVARFDYQNIAADELLPVMGKGREIFFSELKQAEKSGVLKHAEADEILVSFGTAEAIQERGSDDKSE